MWKHILEGFTQSAADRLSLRCILVEAALLVAMILTSSWLVRG
jgi:hypothetical protein